MLDVLTYHLSIFSVGLLPMTQPSLDEIIASAKRCFAQNSTQPVDDAILNKKENLYAEARLQFASLYMLTLAEYKTASDETEKEDLLKKLCLLRLMSDRMQTSVKGLPIAVQRLASGQDQSIRKIAMDSARKQLEETQDD